MLSTTVKFSESSSLKIDGNIIITLGPLVVISLLSSQLLLNFVYVSIPRDSRLVLSMTYRRQFTSRWVCTSRLLNGGPSPTYLLNDIGCVLLETYLVFFFFLEYFKTRRVKRGTVGGMGVGEEGLMYFR